MRADVQYNDFRGTAAADISDNLGSKYGDNLDSFSKLFKVNEERFEIIGISIYGTRDFIISLLCIDKNKSTDEKKHIVSMSMDIEHEKEILPILFKRLHIVLHSRFDKEYQELTYDEEIRYSEFHNK